MASPEKREGKLTGYWYGEVRVKATGERYRKRFETRKEALGYEAYIKQVGEEPLTKGSALTGDTLKDMVVRMRASKKGETRDTSGARRLDWFVDRLGHYALASITTKVLDSAVEALEARPTRILGKDRMSDSTINRYLSAISGVFTWAGERDRDLRAPVIPWRKEGGKRIHWFSEDQEDLVVADLENKGWLSEALSLRVLCATGMRWGEFAGLEPHQCQPEWILLDETKTDTPRDVPLNEDLARHLKAMVLTGTIPSYWHMRTRLAASVKACGLSSKLGIHNTRHATATRLIQLEVPLPDVQAFLGHADIKTTMKYVHVEKKALMAASKKLSPRRGQSAPERPETSKVLPFKSVG